MRNGSLYANRVHRLRPGAQLGAIDAPWARGRSTRTSARFPLMVNSATRAFVLVEGSKGVAVPYGAK